MPTVQVDTATLFKDIGRDFTDTEFEDLCFDFGIELEDVTTEKELGLGATDRKIYRIDIPANRYDMLCVQGIARAIRTYLFLGPPATYKVTGDPVSAIRPFVVGAVLRGITFDKLKYDNFIELQDKLHNNICRKRTLVAIGTHDLDKLSPPFRYMAQAPADLAFAPLNQSKKMNGLELMDFYAADRKLSKFLHIIKDEPLYPIIYDSTNTVLSLPPIINGDHSKISLNTKNVFIECTATDLVKANVVLNTIVTMFSQYCAEPFTAHPCKVVYPDGSSYTYPNLAEKTLDIDISYINSAIGISESRDSIIKMIDRMSLKASKLDETKLRVSFPATRSDILHACDVMEDVAIAYNFNKIAKTLPRSSTIAKQLPINALGDKMRREIAQCRYTEVLAFTLCSHDENFAFLGKQDQGEAVVLANPKTAEYQVVRTSLLPGLLKTLGSNTHHALPLQIFEVSDVVLQDPKSDVYARNERHVGCLYNAKTSGFELVHGLVDRLMLMLDVPSGPTGYSISPLDCKTYFPGRCAAINYKGTVVGQFGILHPDVTDAFGITGVCSALEFNLEAFL